MQSEWWPGTPVPETRLWAHRCSAALGRLDAALSKHEAQLLAEDMGTEAHWRVQEPEAAALRLFAPMPRYQDRKP
jgi:hypothetical protein